MTRKTRNTKPGKLTRLLKKGVREHTRKRLPIYARDMLLDLNQHSEHFSMFEWRESFELI